MTGTRKPNQIRQQAADTVSKQEFSADNIYRFDL